ncbi:hypothetical protein IIV6-T1_455 [Invertebrate iridescent virus 6]|nr:hypothetical protein IIV6-T1_455 [Invertebrate iridescent virus 6]
MLPINIHHALHHQKVLMFYNILVLRKKNMDCHIYPLNKQNDSFINPKLIS